MSGVWLCTSQCVCVHLCRTGPTSTPPETETLDHLNLNEYRGVQGNNGGDTRVVSDTGPALYPARSSTPTNDRR